MKAWQVGVFALMTGLATAAEAASRIPGQPHPVMTPLEQAATACFAETVMANPAAIGYARAGRWYEAAGVIGFLCRPEVDAMIRAHDRLYGRGTGDRYFQTAYTRHLGRELAARLQPLLERKDVASAEPPAEKGSSSDAAGEADRPE